MGVYFQEKWVLDQHKAMVQSAEEMCRLDGWEPRERLSTRVATRLRRLADRIEGKSGARVVIFPG
jgi:hypothetical protein